MFVLGARKSRRLVGHGNVADLNTTVLLSRIRQPLGKLCVQVLVIGIGGGVLRPKSPTL
jgi:hypothetical protein